MAERPAERSPAAPAAAGAGEPERLLIAARLETAEGPRYLFARWPDWPHPALLSLAAPPDDGFAEGVRSLLHARLGVRCDDAPRASPLRVPVRMSRLGGVGVGWLRPVAVRVSGEPAPDALLEGVETLSLDEALAALPTEVERTVLREAAALFD